MSFEMRSGRHNLKSDDTKVKNLRGPGIFPFETNNIGVILQQALRSYYGRQNTNPVLLPKKFVLKVHLRNSCKIIRDTSRRTAENYKESLFSANWQYLPDTGKSGCKYFLTHDEEFIIKTLHFKEHKCLKEVLPGISRFLNENKKSLLPRYYGHYSYKGSGKKIRFVVMNNILPSDLYIDTKFDLKGATKRKKFTTVCKDAEFNKTYPRGLALEEHFVTRLREMCEPDCRHLKTQGLTNYSLFIAVHDVEKEDVRDNMRVNNNTLNQHAQTRESLGFLGYRSRGVPGEISNGKNVLLYIGIIHILQPYTFGRRVEHFFKSILPGGNKTPVQPPDQFEQRFTKHVIEDWFKIKGQSTTYV